MNIFLISDTHFSHYNILKYCNRPFSSVQEHDQTLINNWNSVVGKNDMVYHLGDVAFGSPDRCRQIVDRLNGKIFLIKGNHDKALKKEVYSSRFVEVRDYYELTIQIPDKRLIVLSHYKFQVWNKKHFGSYHLFGHSHGKIQPTNERSMDVGVDINNFTPIYLSYIVKEMESKPFSF